MSALQMPDSGAFGAIGPFCFDEHRHKSIVLSPPAAGGHPYHRDTPLSIDDPLAPEYEAPTLLSISACARSGHHFRT